MFVKQIYTKYQIPPNLQKHMLRVAALSQLLVENWEKGNLDKESITLACLFHDMANIIKFDFSKQQLFKSDIHLAKLEICKQEIKATILNSSPKPPRN